jgi:hypothetical protein
MWLARRCSSIYGYPHARGRPISGNRAGLHMHRKWNTHFRGRYGGAPRPPLIQVSGPEFAPRACCRFERLRGATHRRRAHAPGGVGAAVPRGGRDREGRLRRPDLLHATRLSADRSASCSCSWCGRERSSPPTALPIQGQHLEHREGRTAAAQAPIGECPRRGEGFLVARGRAGTPASTRRWGGNIFRKEVAAQINGGRQSPPTHKPGGASTCRDRTLGRPTVEAPYLSLKARMRSR